MTKDTFKNFSYLLITIFLTLGLSISFQSLLAAWVAPASNPPDSNTDAPVNVGSSPQSKLGPLTINFENIAATGLVAYGNVGIGTAAPGAKLNVETSVDDNGIYLKGTSAIANAKLRLINDAGIFSDIYTIRSAGSTSAGDLWFDVNSGTTAMVIDVGGNVGIGTAGPSRILHIEGSGSGRGQISLTQSGTVATDSSAGIYWHSNSDYAIYRTPGAWTASNYQQLKLDWPTGIILDPGTGDNAGYNKSYVEITGGKGLRVTQGNVGIGTAAPEKKLTINGGGLIGSGINDVFRLSGGAMTTANDATGLLFIQRDANNDYGAAIRLVTTQSTPAWLNPRLDFAVQNPNTNTQANIGVKMSILGNGNVGIGIAAPGAKLDVQGDTNITGDVSLVNNKSIKLNSVSNTTLFVGNYNTGGFAYGTGQTASLAVEGDVKGNQLCIKDVCQNSWSGIGGTSGWTDDGTAVRLTTISDKVGIGTAAPSAKLQVNPPAGTEGLKIVSSTFSPLVITNSSNADLLRLNENGNLYIKGNLTVLAGGSDVAEEFSTDENYPAGTVLVMADQGYKSARMSVEPYDNKVIGAVSDNPALLMGRVVSEKKAIVAMIGVIKVKVTTENGEISKGDLLTTSATPGHAMKATEGKIGTIIGKALENFTSERGEIMVFVNLQ